MARRGVGIIVLEQKILLIDNRLLVHAYLLVLSPQYFNHSLLTFVASVKKTKGLTD